MHLPSCQELHLVLKIIWCLHAWMSIILLYYIVLCLDLVHYIEALGSCNRPDVHQLKTHVQNHACIHIYYSMLLMHGLWAGVCLDGYEIYIK